LRIKAKGCIAAVVSLLSIGVVLPASAAAAPPFKDIGTAGGPLNHVYVANELSCQIQHTGDSVFEFYPSAAVPGDCGTFLFVAGAGTLFTPNFSSHDTSATSFPSGSTAFTPVGTQTTSGSGSGADPFKVVTVADAGATGLRLTETDTYVAGSESYRTDVTVQNTGAGAQSGVIYRAGDCFLQDSDTGFGFLASVPAGTGVGCSATANNSPPNRIEEWVPITGGSSYTEDDFSTVWSQINAHSAFPNACAQCTTNTDNGAGLSWPFSVAGGASQTFSHTTTFSPTGGVIPTPSAGGGGGSTPTATPTPTPAATPIAPPTSNVTRTLGPTGNPLGLPSNKKCIDKRKFTFRLRRPAGRVVDVRISINGVPTGHKTGSNITRLTIARLPNSGKFKVRIEATSADGTKLISQRTYTRCKKSRVKGKKIKHRR
jgi:hypothetical protein